MEDSNIGTELVHFYKEKIEFLESSKNFKEANDALLHCQKVKARPLEEIPKLILSFEKRMEKRLDNFNTKLVKKVNIINNEEWF